MINAITSYNNPLISTEINKIIFLAGPCSGSIDWQRRFINLFNELNARFNKIENYTIANPRVPPNIDVKYIDQVKWETYYLNRAGTDGLIVFWLQSEIKPIPYRSFARTTRFELGEWIAKSSRTSFNNFLIGIHPKFEGKEYIETRLKLLSYPHYIPNNLKDLAKDSYKRLV